METSGRALSRRRRHHTVEHFLGGLERDDAVNIREEVLGQGASSCLRAMLRVELSCRSLHLRQGRVGDCARLAGLERLAWLALADEAKHTALCTQLGRVDVAVGGV